MTIASAWVDKGTSNSLRIFVRPDGIDHMALPKSISVQRARRSSPGLVKTSGKRSNGGFGDGVARIIAHGPEQRADFGRVSHGCVMLDGRLLDVSAQAVQRVVIALFLEDSEVDHTDQHLHHARGRLMLAGCRQASAMSLTSWVVSLLTGMLPMLGIAKR